MTARRHTVFGRVVRALARLVLAALCLWAGGFAWFLYQVHQEPPLPLQADGIVVLTGGADRLEAGFQLLERGHAPRLLISGVSRAASLADLTRLSSANPALWAFRVTVGHEAVTTHGNAAEAAEWGNMIGAKTLIVVTANYHMPRALLELKRAMPQMTLYAAPVVPPAFREGFSLNGMAFLTWEYTKYLGAMLGFSRLVRVSAYGALAPGAV